MHGKYELQKLPKDYRSLFRLAEAQGWEHTRTGKDHHRFVSPEGTIVVTSGTPSDKRSLENFRADMRRAGLRPYMPLKEDNKLSEPKLVVSKVEGDSTTPVPPVSSKPKRQLTPKGVLRDIVLNTLRDNDKPEGLTAKELLELIGDKMPSRDPNGINATLSYYYKQGVIDKPGYSRYRVKQPVVAPVVEDDDAKVLDEVIAALAKAEGVIRRMQERERRLKELKEALAAIK